jgi:putative transposase
MVKNFLLEAQHQEERIKQLRSFIRTNPDVRELKRALAVKMALEEKPYAEISTLLEINRSVITYWKQRFIEQGIAGIKLGYQGAKSLLSTDERQEIIHWLETKQYWNLDELVTHIDVKYGVIYQSKQSYYDIFHEAGISWKKPQKINPKSDPEAVKKKE